MDERFAASQIDRWSREHREELIEDLKALIRIPSIVEYDQELYPMGSACKQALDCFETFGKKYGFECVNHEDYALSILSSSYSSSERELGMLGHLDVVSAGDGWTTPPYQPVLHKGYLFGRGSLDNKGPLVMCLYVMRCIRDLQLPITSRIRLIAGCDEEMEMRDIRHYLSLNQPPAFTLNCDGAWPVCLGEKGTVIARVKMKLQEGSRLETCGGVAINTVPDQAQAIIPSDMLPDDLPDGLWGTCNESSVCIKATGLSAHCSAPALGCNAIRELIEYLQGASLLSEEERHCFQKLWACFPDDDGTGLRIHYADSISGKTTCVPTLLSTQNGEIAITINIRYSVSQQYMPMIERMNKRCRSLGMEAEVLSHIPPRQDSLHHPIIRMLLQTSQKYVGKQHKPYYTGGGTHSRFFPNSIPFGPEKLLRTRPKRFGRPHGPNEAVCIDDLLEGIKIYTIALLKLDGYFENLEHEK